MTPQKIKQLRDRHGLPQERFAKMAYTTKRTVQRWEQGKTPVCPARYHVALVKLEKLHPDTAFDLRLHAQRMEKEGWL